MKIDINHWELTIYIYFYIFIFRVHHRKVHIQITKYTQEKTPSKWHFCFWKQQTMISMQMEVSNDLLLVIFPPSLPHPVPHRWLFVCFWDPFFYHTSVVPRVNYLLCKYITEDRNELLKSSHQEGTVLQPCSVKSLQCSKSTNSLVSASALSYFQIKMEYWGI